MALDNFHQGVWAKHGQTLTLRNMVAHVKLSGKVAPHPDILADGQTSHLELSDVPLSAGRPSDWAIAL